MLILHLFICTHIYRWSLFRATSEQKFHLSWRRVCFNIGLQPQNWVKTSINLTVLLKYLNRESVFGHNLIVLNPAVLFLGFIFVVLSEIDVSVFVSTQQALKNNLKLPLSNKSPQINWATILVMWHRKTIYLCRVFVYLAFIILWTCGVLILNYALMVAYKYGSELHFSLVYSCSLSRCCVVCFAVAEGGTNPQKTESS